MQWRCRSWPLCLQCWGQGLVWGCIMTVEGGGSTCSWTASGVDRLWAFVELSMETYEMTSCEELLPTNRYNVEDVNLPDYVCVCRSPAGMIEGTPQLHANAWKVSSACVAPVNLPIVDPCEMNQNNGNNVFLFVCIMLCELVILGIF